MQENSIRFPAINRTATDKQYDPSHNDIILVSQRWFPVSFICASSLFSHYFNRLEHDINMKSFADLKANARVALLGRYSTLIGAGHDQLADLRPA